MFVRGCARLNTSKIGPFWGFFSLLKILNFGFQSEDHEGPCRRPLILGASKVCMMWGDEAVSS